MSFDKCYVWKLLSLLIDVKGVILQAPTCLGVKRPGPERNKQLPARLVNSEHICIETTIDHAQL